MTGPGAEDAAVPQVATPAARVIPSPSQTQPPPVARVYGGNPETIPVGTSLDQLDDLLGPPDLQTTTVVNGSLHQVYVYRRKPGLPTYLHILDGRVIGKRPLR